MNDPKIQSRLNLGPIHHWLPGPMRLSIDLHGDQMVSGAHEFGYAKKDVEKKILGTSFVQARHWFSRIEPESAVLLDRIFSEAVEECLGWSVEDRAVWIREVSTTVSEFSSMLKYLAVMAEAMGLLILKNILLKHREELLDLTELLTGSRYGYCFVRAGGVRYDITEGFLERIEIWIKNYLADFDRIQSMFLWSHTFQNRLQAIGTVVDGGKFGFVSETSVQTTHVGLVSQVESRLVFVLNCTRSCADEIMALVATPHKGAFLVEGWNKRIKPASTRDLVCWRGEWALELKLGEDLKVESMKVGTPSDAILGAIIPALESEYFEDTPLILKSLGFLVTEIDR